MTTAVKLCSEREELAAMIRELQANRLILNGSLDCIDSFRFTGGAVPREPWALHAIIAYVRNPFAADQVVTTDVQRYRQLADTIMDLEQAIAADARPRTLRCRHDLADRFDRASSEIHALANTLESAATAALGEASATPLTATDRSLLRPDGSA